MSHQEIPSGLDSATRQQEKDLVIDLAPDRILYHIGVNLLIILAVITKLTEETGSKLACFPIDEAGSTLQFVKYTDSFCWQSPATALNSSMNECPFPNNQTFVKQEQLLQSPVYMKRMIQWLPYVMLLEAFLFALPMAYWHFTLGAVLMGHLKFMRLLLESIYETLKELSAGIYRKEAYDPESTSFNCWRQWGKIGNKKAEEWEAVNSRPPSPAPDNKGNSSPRDSSLHDSNNAEETLSTKSNDSALSNQSHDHKDETRKPLLSTTMAFKNEKIESKYPKRRSPTDRRSHTGTGREAGIPLTEIAPKDTKESEDTALKEMESNQCQSEVTSQEKNTPLKDDIDEQHTEVEEILSKASQFSDENRTCSPDQSDSTTQKRDRCEDVIQTVIQPNFTERWKAIRNRSRPTEETTETDDKTETKQKKMQDRHIFSMLCYENFASMQHQPYLESVEKLSRVESFEDMFAAVPSASNNQSGPSEEDKNSEGIILPLKHAILRSFCDENNFNGCVVVTKYQIKSALTIALGALVWMLIFATFVFVVLPTLRSDSFLCYIPYHEKYCSVCTISGLVDVHAAFFSNWIAVTLHLVISSVNLFYFTRARSRAIAHFLDDIKPLCCVALVAAYEKADAEKKDDKTK